MDMAWYKNAYRRNVVDMHIADWDERFLSQFDARAYVDMLKLAQADAAVVYAHSHVGHSNYPTKVGHPHASLKGRDIVGEVVGLCHSENIAVVLYYSLVYDDYAYRKNPDWRIIGDPDARTGVAENSRYGVCCPNSPYREYARSHTRELVGRYQAEGVRLDMTFWPAVCYCQHCQARFAQEIGGDLPTVIDWGGERWVAFQRSRERWLTDFATYITEGIKNVNPSVTVEHQASTYTANWRFGVTHDMASANDFLQGDFYGDILQGSLARKLFTNLSPNLPYGFETSFSVSLNNHTAKKPRELLQAKASACLADAGAFVFIDAIDPVGTLNPAVYERMGRVFDETKAYEPYIGGELCQDVAIYLSTESKFDPADSGKPVHGSSLSHTMPHLDSVMGALRALVRHHIPYGVITKRNIGALDRHKVIILPDVLMMDEDEVSAFRQYVQSGGKLYASHTTSLVSKEGVRHWDFALADVFGVSYAGETAEDFTYIAPCQGSETLLGDYTAQHPAAIPSSQYLLSTHEGAKALGTLTLPYTNPSEPRRYASIHSNPPGICTAYPSIVINRYGSGLAVYSAARVEALSTLEEVFAELLLLMEDRYTFRSDAPGAVELTAFHQPERRRYVIGAVNFQKELPNIPVDAITIRFRPPQRQPISRLLLLPEEQEWPCRRSDDEVIFTVPRLDTLHMFAADY